MQTKSIEAIILGRKNWGEADRLVFAYSDELGKIKFIAKGSRKIKSKMASHIEPFTVGKYGLVQGKTYFILTSAEGINQNQNLSANLEAYSEAAYLCELLDLATEENLPNEKIYETAKDILGHLNKLDSAKRKIALRFFEFLLLDSQGYKPSYQKCKKCGTKLSENEYFWGDFEGVFCENCGKQGQQIDKNTFKILRIFETGDFKKALAVQNGEEYSGKLQDIITGYLYDILPKIPKTKSYESKY